jgi:hypothetical protein
MTTEVYPWTADELRMLFRARAAVQGGLYCDYCDHEPGTRRMCHLNLRPPLSGWQPPTVQVLRGLGWKT